MLGNRGKVLLAMSGGVDSSVAGALLLREGYEVVGCFMRLGAAGESPEACPTGAAAPRAEARGLGRGAIKHRGCCSVSDAADARLVAAQLGIPLYVCNFRRDFGRIVEYFADEYAAGRTPNPCVRCNDWLKFGKLHDYARELGCEFVASGHYARIVRTEGGGARLARGIDAAKDQSYVLFGVERGKLASMLLPIGEMRKSEVRGLAEELGLPVFDKPDSQEICFVPDDDYAGLLGRLRPELGGARGEIVDTAGRVLGEHAGQHRFTIGQRRRVGVALGRPVYVVERDAASGRVTVGDAADLLVETCLVGEANWLTGAVGAGETIECLAQFRAHGEACDAVVTGLAPGDRAGPSGRAGRFGVRFAAPQPAVAAGQALVLYDRAGVVWGGGWIERTAPRGGVV